MYFSNQDSEAGSVPYTHFTIYTNKHCTLISDCSRFWSSCCTPYFAATTEAQLCWRLTTFTLSTNPYFCGSAWRTAGWKRQRQMSNEVFDTHRLCVYSIDKRSKQIQIEEICSTLHSRRLRTDLQPNCPKPPLHQDSWSRDHAGNAHSVFPCPLLNTEVQWVNNTECSSLLWAFPPVSRVSWSCTSVFSGQSLPCRESWCWSQGIVRFWSQSSCSCRGTAPAPGACWSSHSSWAPRRPGSLPWYQVWCCSHAPRTWAGTGSRWAVLAASSPSSSAQHHIYIKV